MNELPAESVARATKAGQDGKCTSRKSWHAPVVKEQPIEETQNDFTDPPVDGFGLGGS